MLLISATVLVLLGPNFDEPNPGVLPTFSHWMTHVPPFLERRLVLATGLLTTWGVWYGIRANRQSDRTPREHSSEDQQFLETTAPQAQLKYGATRPSRSWLRSVLCLVLCGMGAAIVLAIGAMRDSASHPGPLFVRDTFHLSRQH